MRKNHVFRPQVSEILEPRAVPSMAGVTVSAGIPNVFVTLPAQVPLSSPQVKAAFTAFDQSYIQAVDTLLASGSEANGLLIISSNSQANFYKSIEASLQTLAEQLILSLGTTTTTGSTTTTTGSTTTTTGSNSTVANQVTAAIVGGSNSLQSELLALSISQIQAQVPITSAGSGGSGQTVVPNAVSTAEQVRPTTVVPVAEAVGPASTTDTGSTASASSSASASDAVRSAFGNFLNDYFKAVQGTLLAAGSNGQVNPQANRAAFNAKVDQALQSLETSLTASLARYPATSALGPQIQSAIEGSGTSSLKTQLANLATPEAAQASIVRNFTLGSTQAIAQVLAAITGDLSKLLAPAGP